MAFERPDYPAKLTDDYWQSNKGLVAKLAGATEMGQHLGRLHAAFGAVDWDLFEFRDLTRGSNNPHLGELAFSLDKLDRLVHAARAELDTGHGAVVRQEATKTRDHARVTERQYRASKVIPKKAGDLCAEIATAADHFGAGFTAAGFKPAIDKEEKLARASWDLVHDQVHHAVAGLAHDCQNALAEFGADLTERRFKAAAVATRTRNLTTQLSNAAKLEAMGYRMTVDVQEMDRINKLLEPFANPKSDYPFAQVKDDDLKRLVDAAVHEVIRLEG